MILGIDVGNTDTVAAIIENGKPVRQVRYRTVKDETDVCGSENFRRIINGYDLEGVIISSVVPEANSRIAALCFELLRKEPIFVSSKLNTGLTYKHKNPEKIGADIICGAVGAVKKYGYPVIIVDIGTATTFFAVSGSGVCLGGAIAPGPHISMKALVSAASQLGEINLIPTNNAIGTSTEECMKIGLLTAHAAMIDGMLERIKEEMGEENVIAVVTGGRSRQIIPMCKQEIICDENLLMYGLYELYIMN